MWIFNLAARGFIKLLLYFMFDTWLNVYSIIAGNGAENFFINSTTLSLIPSKTSKLDREAQPIYYLSITAEDNDGLSSKASLIVVIDDVNDNTPLFNQTQFNVSLREDAAVGTVLLDAKATDKDTGSNSVISYSLRGGDDLFTLNRTPGFFYFCLSSISLSFQSLC